MNALQVLNPLIEAHAHELKKPGVLYIRPGYKTEDGWPTKQPAIIVVKSPDAKDPDVPSQIGSTPVEVRPATEVEQFRHNNPEAYEKVAAHRTELRSGAFPEVDPAQEDVQPAVVSADGAAVAVAMEPLAAGPHIDYKPADVPLTKVSGKLSITCHASPDAGWPTLREFLSRTERSLTVGIYDFTSAHVLQQVDQSLTGDKQLKITLDNPALNPTADQSDTDSLKKLSDDLGDKLKAAWALVRTDKVPRPWIFPSAYHIKVAVRDSQSVWLSSGNWNNSNQPDMDPIGNPQPNDQQLARKSDRDWHVIVDNQPLANTYEAYLKNDFNVASEAEGGGFEPMELEAEETVPPEFELEAKTPAWRFFAPLRLENEQMSITPLLTPDEGIYQPAMLNLIGSAKKKLYIQLQYIHPSDEDEDRNFEALVDAVAAKINARVDVRIIVSQFQRSNGWLDRLQAAGIDLSVVRIQNGVHNKGFVIDGAAVALGSQNWSGDGALRNRDASVIIENQKAAAYYESIFLHDWDNVAHQSVN